jgi:hypothetical protein
VHAHVVVILSMKGSSARGRSADFCAVQSLIYAGQIIEDDRQLKEYHVPPVSPIEIDS